MKYFTQRSHSTSKALFQKKFITTILLLISCLSANSVIAGKSERAEKLKNALTQVVHRAHLNEEDISGQLNGMFKSWTKIGNNNDGDARNMKEIAVAVITADLLAKHCKTQNPKLKVLTQHQRWKRDYKTDRALQRIRRKHKAVATNYNQMVKKGAAFLLKSNSYRACEALGMQIEEWSIDMEDRYPNIYRTVFR